MLSFKLIPFLFMLFAAINISLAAPVIGASDLVARMTDGCYMVLTPDPRTEMLTSVAGKGYEIKIKFGDGAEADRHMAYATTNPTHLFMYSKTGSMRGCGKLIEGYALQKLRGKDQKLVVPSQTNKEWYTISLGTKVQPARDAYKIMEEQMASFKTDAFTTDTAKAWAEKFVTAMNHFYVDWGTSIKYSRINSHS